MSNNILDNIQYREDIIRVASIDLPWNLLQDKILLLSGATGLIGSFLIDVILEKNITSNLNCTVIALGRNELKANIRFKDYIGNPNFVFLPHDVNNPLEIADFKTVDYILHLASNAQPYLYATDPIGTITTNIFGLYNLLEFAYKHNSHRFIFASSNEMYGENRGDVDLFKEDYCGYIDCNSLRAGYPESKRCGEALCQAYRTQKNMDIVIARFTRTFGPTMSLTDTKAVCQFISKGVSKENIVLKSSGDQFYSYLYVADAVSGLLNILFKGIDGEAYNISDTNCDIRLKDLANTISRISGTKVIYEKSDAIEASGYSKVTKARLDGSKLKSLGWIPQFNIEEGLERTIHILQNI